MGAAPSVPSASGGSPAASRSALRLAERSISFCSFSSCLERVERSRSERCWRPLIAQCGVAETGDIDGFIAFREGWIDQLYVRPELQRRSFGRAPPRQATKPIRRMALRHLALVYLRLRKPCRARIAAHDRHALLIAHHVVDVGKAVRRECLDGVDDAFGAALA